ncbi:GNAT family N-acetyltransferase [Phyllobacterium myrsinacearum]|uniref:GNAT superfamily N-acetyltransferase n=1 Tax=Phyllobacterium myrsinacearum TaxID=28101 RepID=A0A839ENF9_9HYPH|nr:GNAT family N-acetyltransferase [Phyllobacterium myrsinacearum]MBA8880382.1 GNAT superfamily N-acetyltransferase [Phyllobacterium myrsinacearum]
MTSITRIAGRPDIATIIDWAAAEGWNPGLDDAGVFWASDPDGYHVLEINGELAAAISLVRYGRNYAFLGFYMVHPQWRGQGLGWTLWQSVLNGFAGQTIGLDGVIAQQENYRKSGFAYAHANYRFGGVPNCAAPKNKEIVAIDGGLTDAVSAYDSGFNPEPRSSFIRAWLGLCASRQGMAWIVDGRIAGYGVVRECRQGYKIGPLFAETAEIADGLFQSLAAEAGDKPVFLDIPGPNATARGLCERYGLTPVFETARMYRGPAPELPLDRIFGITTFELG